MSAYTFSLTVNGVIITITGEGKPPDIHVKPTADPTKVIWPKPTIADPPFPYRVNESGREYQVTWS